MSDLIDFLTARYDDEERTAKAAMFSPESRREFGGEGSLSETRTGGNGYFATGPWGGGIDDEYAEHIVAWQPARVLAEVGVKRQIVRAHRRVRTSDRDSPERLCGMCGGGYPCTTLKLMALPYSGDDGYEEVWEQ